jgi:hypothetical protein
MANNDLGFQEASDEAFGALLAEHADDDAYNIAMAFAWRGESDKAFDWLDRAISHGQSVYGIKTDPFFQGLTGDPRWDSILERLGLTDDQVVDILL